MTEPRFLSLAEVLRLHRSSIEAYGGDIGVRDLGLLESAMSQARANFGGTFLHEDLAAMAAAYLFHIVSNYPFIDGNKRTGALTAYVFLQMNDIEFTASEKAFGDAVLEVACGRMSKEKLTEFVRLHTQPV